MANTLDHIKELIRPALEEMNVHLVKIELRGHRNSRVLSVFVDTDAGISLHQITNLTREIEDILDLHDPIEGSYRLNVSSPGTDWPLKETWQFRKNIGRNLNIYYEINAEKKHISGKLKEIENNNLLLETKSGDKTIPVSDIKKAVVKLDW